MLRFGLSNDKICKLKAVFWCSKCHKCFSKLKLGGRRGLVVIVTAYGAKGRRIESRSFSFFYSVQFIAKKKRKSTKVSRNEEIAIKEGGSGESKKKDRQAFQEWRSRS